MDKKILGRFPKLIAVSSEIGRELIRHGASPEAVTTILNGIDHQQFVRTRSREGEIRQSYGFSPDEVVLGAVGRLEPPRRTAGTLRPRLLPVPDRRVANVPPLDAG